MNDFKNTLENLLTNYNSRVPKTSDPIKRISKKLKFIIDNKDSFTTELNQIANKYINDNNLKESEIKNVLKISKEYLVKFSSPF